MSSSENTLDGFALYLPCSAYSTIFCIGTVLIGKSLVPNMKLAKKLRFTEGGMFTRGSKVMGSLPPRNPALQTVPFFLVEKELQSGELWKKLTEASF
jgi:hypothetical protein